MLDVYYNWEEQIGCLPLGGHCESAQVGSRKRNLVLASCSCARSFLLGHFILRFVNSLSFSFFLIRILCFLLSDRSENFLFFISFLLSFAENKISSVKSFSPKQFYFYLSSKAFPVVLLFVLSLFILFFDSLHKCFISDEVSRVCFRAAKSANGLRHCSGRTKQDIFASLKPKKRLL